VSMAYTKSIPIRFPDVDFAHVVYFPRFFDYCHQVFEDFFTDEVKCPYPVMLQERKVGYPSVHAEADFKSPLRFGDTARVVMAVTRLSDRSVTCRYQLFKGSSEELCATVTVVVAPIEMGAFRGTTLPADVKAAFERHLVKG
jgi:4-hydroxybenzoyl-CoA thioesterase